MWFKNIQLYRLPAPWDMSAERLAEQLERRSFKPCGSQDLVSSGWAPVTPNKLVHNVGGQWLIALGIEQRLLPSAVVRQEAEKRAAACEREQGFKPGRKQMKEIQEAVTQELLPRAFTRQRRVFAWIDPKAGWLAIEASSRSSAEPVVEALFKTLDELPLKLINTEFSPSSAMTGWLCLAGAPNGFTIDQDCVLQAVTGEGSKVRYSRHNLNIEEIGGHIADGKQAACLALTFDDRLSFMLTDKFEIKRLQPLEVLTNTDDGDAKTREEQFDADWALMAGELGKLIPALIDALGGEVAAV